MNRAGFALCGSAIAAIAISVQAQDRVPPDRINVSRRIIPASQLRDVPAKTCDKTCLTGIADAYFAALAAHDPSKAPMAPSAKFTEQTKVLAVGEGLWKTASEAPTTFKVYVPDPVPASWVPSSR